jgi:hypothetical protein
LEREGAIKYAISNDYEIKSEPYFSDVAYLPPNDVAKEHGDQWELLRRRGLEEGEVDFLRWVMRADPRKRPSAEQILGCGWLDKTDEEAASGFRVPVNPVGRPSMEFDPRRTGPAIEALRRESPTFRPSEAAVRNSPLHQPIKNLPSRRDASDTAYQQSTSNAAHQDFANGIPSQQSNGNHTISSKPTDLDTRDNMLDAALNEIYATRRTYDHSSQKLGGTPALTKPSDLETTKPLHFETSKPTNVETSNTTHFEISKPANSEAREHMVDAALEEVYATRNTYKHRPS